MRDRPDELVDEDIRSALASGWDIDTAAMQYVPLGGGSYHWQVRAEDGLQWFVSATDLDHSPWLGADRSSALRTLRVTMTTAWTLRTDVGLAFVLAPVPGSGGDTVRSVRRRYGLVVHPFVDGACGEFGAPLAPADVQAVVDIVAALHRTPTASVDLHPLVDLGARDSLEQTNAAFGPLLARYDDLFEDVRHRPVVITHGEPHAGNVMRSGEDVYLIDWDTAALASPERDLWLLHDHGNTEVLRIYEDTTGHAVAPAALAFYRLRFAIEELACAVGGDDAIAVHQAIAKARAAAGL